MRTPIAAILVATVIAISLQVAAQDPPPGGDASSVEDIYIARSWRESRVEPTPYCDAARTAFAGSIMEDRYTFHSVATRTTDGLVTDADAGTIGELHACFGPLPDDAASFNFYAEGKLNGVTFTGRGNCLSTRENYPEPGVQWIPLLPRSDGPSAGVRRRSARDQHDRTRAHGPCRDTGSAGVRAAVDRNRSPLEAPRRVRRHRLHEVLRVVPRPGRRANSDARRARRDVAGAHSAHARLRADDEHRVSDEARRARSRRGVSRQRGEDAAPPPSALCGAGHTDHEPVRRKRAGPAGDRRKTTRAIKLPSAQDSAPPTSRGSSSNGRTVLPATSSRSRRPPS